MTQWSRAAPLFPGKDSRTFAITLDAPTTVASSPTPAETAAASSSGSGGTKKKRRKVPFGIIAPEPWDMKRRDRPQKTYVLTVDSTLSPRGARKKCVMSALSPEPTVGSPDASLLDAQQQRAAFRAKRQERYKLERVFPVLVKPELLPEWGGGSDQSSGGEEAKGKMLTARRGTVVSLQRQRDRLKESEERQKRSQDAAGRWNVSGRATALSSRKDPVPLLALQDEEIDVLKQQVKESPPPAARASLIAGEGGGVEKALAAARRGSASPTMYNAGAPQSLTAEVREKGRQLVQEMSQRVNKRASLMRKEVDFSHFEHRIKMAGLKVRMKEVETQEEGEGNGDESEEKDVLAQFKKRMTIIAPPPGSLDLDDDANDTEVNADDDE